MADSKVSVIATEGPDLGLSDEERAKRRDLFALSAEVAGLEEVIARVKAAAKGAKESKVAGLKVKLAGYEKRLKAAHTALAKLEG